MCIFAQIGEGAQVEHAAEDVELLRLLDGPAGVGDLGGDELVKAALDDVGHTVQHLGAVVDAGLSPGAALGLVRGLHRLVHQRRVGFVHLGQQLAVQRADVVEALVGGYELAVNVIAQCIKCGRQRGVMCGHGRLRNNDAQSLGR